MLRTLLTSMLVVLVGSPVALSQESRMPETKPAVKKAADKPRVKAASKPVAVRVDARQFTGRERTVYHVKHVPAIDLANTLGELLRSETEEDAPAAKGQAVVLVPDPITNTLIVSAPAEVLEEIAYLVRELDRRPSLVRVRTLIAEITVADPKDGDAVALDDVTTSVSDKSIDELAAALKKRPGLRILARPQLTALDNQPAYLQLGQRVPRITGATVSSRGRVNNVELENVGLILGVTTRVNDDKLLTMEIDLEKSALGPEEEGVPLVVSDDGKPVRASNVDTLTVQTTISAASGQTVIVGGMSAKSETRRKEVILLASPEIVPEK